MIILNQPSILPMYACPEHELLICSARNDRDAKNTERLRTLLQNEIDWDYLIQTATHHGVMPLLYQRLNEICAESIPETTSIKLQEKFCANVGHNLALTSELLKILELLTAHKIQAIPFKGPVLTAMAYGNIGLRQFSDLDILVHECDVLRAQSAIASLGYLSEPSRDDRKIVLTDAQKIAHRKWESELMLTRNDGEVTVDLHWRLTRRHLCFTLNSENMWKRLEQVPLFDTPVSNLHSEDLLLYLCVHGTQHSWERLLWICDISQLIKIHQAMDWARVIEQAHKLGTQRILLLGLFLANSLLGAELPNVVRTHI